MKPLPFIFLFSLTTLAGASSPFPQPQWKIRDVAANSAWLTPDEAKKSNLDLSIHSQSNNPPRFSCTVSDSTGKERSITLALCFRLPDSSCTWHDDPERSRPINGDQPLSNCSDRAGGMNDEASVYPLAVISTETTALCLAIPPDHERMVRFAADPKHRELRAEFDFGLSPIPTLFPSRADATVIAYEVPKRWPFRSALARYYALFPQSFQRRIAHGGIWCPFIEPANIEHPEDFSFGFHEIADTQIADAVHAKKLLDFDHHLGCGAYVYVEPQTYWQQYTGKGAGTYEDRLAQLKAEAKTGVGFAQATLTSGVFHADGKRDLYLEPQGYTTQQPWGSDPSPFIPTDPQTGYPSKAQVEFDRLGKALGWRDKHDLGADGVYVDSMEGWSELLDYNHEHWKVTHHPLTFDPASKKVALLNFWGTYEWVKEMSSRLHAHKKTLFGNDAYFRRWQLFPFVDVAGREYTWIHDTRFTPVEDEHYLFLRAMSAKRPYLMLMNNRYDLGQYIEPYFQRSLFYAVYPSMYFGHTSASEMWYFSNRDWYNRDRALFKKYIPLIRKLDLAGWEAVPNAIADPPAVRIERYGQFGKSSLAFTIHNPTDQLQHLKLRLLREELGLPATIQAHEWLASRRISIGSEAGDPVLNLDLPAGAYAALDIH